MLISLFGGSGKTGQILLQKALDLGYSVQLLARTPAKVDITHPNLSIIEGNAQDPLTVERTIAGAQAVICLMGPTKGQPPFAISQAVGNILDAMQSNQVRRLVISAGAGVGDALDQPTTLDRLFSFLLKTAAREAYQDMKRTAQMVRESPLEWTLVRVPMLTDDPALESIRVGYLGSAGTRLPRANLAAFMLHQLQDNQYIYKAPVLSL
jgi:putative NADH-flavin reductase